MIQRKNTFHLFVFMLFLFCLKKKKSERSSQKPHAKPVPETDSYKHVVITEDTKAVEKTAQVLEEEAVKRDEVR